MGCTDVPPLVSIRDLRITARTDDGGEAEIVKGVSLDVNRGEVIGLIGESGSGKTTIALATMGYARYGCRIASGTILLGEDEITALSEGQLRAIRGKRIAYIAQSAAASFNPSRAIMSQVVESALIHGTASEADARAKAIDLFRALAIPSPETIGDRYPHQVSGGQLQRLMAAMALITDPEVVIFDEPTTALDVTTQIEVLKAFKSAIRTATQPASMSPTTSPSSRRSPTASSCSAMVRCRRPDRSMMSSPPPPIPTPAACWRQPSPLPGSPAPRPARPASRCSPSTA